MERMQGFLKTEALVNLSRFETGGKASYNNKGWREEKIRLGRGDLLSKEGNTKCYKGERKKCKIVKMVL